MSLDNVFRLSVIVSMIDRLSDPLRRQRRETDESASSLERFSAQMNDMKSAGLGMVAVGTGITAATTALAKSTFDTSNALGELSSLGVENLKAVESAATEFSNTFAGTTKADFISAAYDIKSGISSLNDEGVAGYTALAGTTAKATKASIGEMTSLFATGYGIYKDYYADLSDVEFGEMFGAGIAKSVQAFKTDGSQLAEAISSIGASATSAQVPMEEQLAIMGMLQATMGGGEAGTQYSAFLGSAASAGEALGMSFLDANNQLLGMPEILEKIRGKYGETIDAAEKMELADAFGTDEAVSVIDLLYNKTGDLQGNIETLYSAMGEGSSVIEDMADKINSTDPAKYEIMTQKIQNMKESFGSLLLPVLMDFVDIVSGAIDKVTAFAASHQQLMGFILRAVAILGIVLTAVGGVMIVVSGLGMLIAAFIKHITGLGGVIRKLLPLFSKIGSLVLKVAGMFKVFVSTAIMPLISSVWSFTAALLACPITWIVLAVIALIAVVILLWKNWDKVTAFMGKVWGWLTSKISAGIGIIKGAFSSIVNFITGKIEWFRESGKKIVTTLTAGIKSAASAPVNAIKGIFTKVRQFLPFSDAKTGPLSQLTLSGERVLTTMVSGMQKVENLPAEQAGKSFAKIGGAQSREIKKISLTEKTTETAAVGTTKENSKKTIIQKLNINVKLDEIDDIKKLKKLLEQIEDMANSGDDEGSEEDLVFA